MHMAVMPTPGPHPAQPGLTAMHPAQAALDAVIDQNAIHPGLADGEADQPSMVGGEAVGVHLGFIGQHQNRRALALGPGAAAGGQADCQDIAPPPPGDGCDASLDWWLSDEARNPPRRPPPPAPIMPAACGPVFSAR